jgi:hypothetical protein
MDDVGWSITVGVQPASITSGFIHRYSLATGGPSGSPAAGVRWAAAAFDAHCGHAREVAFRRAQVCASFEGRNAYPNAHRCGGWPAETAPRRRAQLEGQTQPTSIRSAVSWRFPPTCPLVDRRVRARIGPRREGFLKWRDLACLAQVRRHRSSGEGSRHIRPSSGNLRTARPSAVRPATADDESDNSIAWRAVGAAASTAADRPHGASRADHRLLPIRRSGLGPARSASSCFGCQQRRGSAGRTERGQGASPGG